MKQHSTSTNDRRRTIRFRAQDNAFAILHSETIIVTSLVDISQDGLSFEYVPDIETAPITGCSLDVFFNDDDLYDFYLQNVPFEIISEIELENTFFKSTLKTNRCGVRFGSLSAAQQSQLDFFLRSHTVHAG